MYSAMYDNEYDEYNMVWKGKLKYFKTKERLEEFLQDNGIFCYELSEIKDGCYKFTKVYMCGDD